MYYAKVALHKQIKLITTYIVNIRPCQAYVSSKYDTITNKIMHDTKHFVARITHVAPEVLLYICTYILRDKI